MVLKLCVQVLAVDRDKGLNGLLQYSIKSGRGKSRFSIHPETGMVFTLHTLTSGQEYDLMVTILRFRLDDCVIVSGIEY